MSVTDVHKEMRAFVEDSFLYMHPDVTLADSDRFLELGVIDSFGFVELVQEVETRYGIEISDIEINEENLGSLDAIAAFVARRRNSE